MAGDTPPTAPPTADYAPLEDYEFDPADELEPGNDLVDSLLTRAGELVLDTIEHVQAHPVAHAVGLAVGLGIVVGLAANAVIPHRRPRHAGERAAEALREASAEASELAGSSWGRLRRARLADRGREGLDFAGQRGREGLDFASQRGREGLEFASRRGREGLDLAAERAERGARFAMPFARRGAERASELADDLRSSVEPGNGAHALRRAGYAAQLGPLAVSLLRNPLVRDLLVQLALRQLRRARP